MTDFRQVGFMIGCLIRLLVIKLYEMNAFANIKIVLITLLLFLFPVFIVLMNSDAIQKEFIEIRSEVEEIRTNYQTSLEKVKFQQLEIKEQVNRLLPYSNLESTNLD